MLRNAAPRMSLSCRALLACGIRNFTTSRLWLLKQMPPRPPHVNEGDITEAFLKGSGPGGQKINKTSSAVQLKHLPTGTVVKVQATRSRSQNRKIARQMLADRVEEIEKGAQSRVAIIGEVKKKRKSSAVKKSKRKYRLLEVAKNGATGAEEGNEAYDVAGKTKSQTG